jgi:hypothetical protein
MNGNQTKQWKPQRNRTGKQRNKRKQTVTEITVRANQQNNSNGNQTTAT